MAKPKIDIGTINKFKMIGLAKSERKRILWKHEEGIAKIVSFQMKSL